MEELKFHYKYPHPNVTTDCVIFGQLDETLTMPNKKEAFLYKFNPESYNEMKEKGFRLEF